MVVTEAGFGADLGAEKFLNIKTRAGDIDTDAVVIVATVRALKMHGGVAKDNLKVENVEALTNGMSNLKKHMETIEQFGLPYVIAINKFPTDTDAEINFIKTWCESNGADVALTEVWEKGGNGGIELAEKVIDKAESSERDFHYTYDIKESLETKIRTITQKIYGATDIELSQKAKKQLAFYENQGWGKLPISWLKPSIP